MHHIPLFHALLRPCILQILRAQGYHAARPSVIDAFTDLTARYLLTVCETAAHHTAHNSSEFSGIVPSIADIRLALEDVGALAGRDSSSDDTRGVDEFVDWVTGPRNKEIKRVALDGEDETNYLEMLKKKHSKSGEDSKYSSTVLGRGTEDGDILVEGGDCVSIASWQAKRTAARQMPLVKEHDGNENENENDDDADMADRGSRSPSSGLSSIGENAIDDMEMELM